MAVFFKGRVKFKHLIHVAQELYLPKWYEGQIGWDNEAFPDVYVLDSAQKYPVGMGYKDGDKFFYYGYIDSVASANRAMGGMKNTAKAQAITAKAVVHAVGEKEIVIVDSTSLINQWAGGDFMPRVHPYSPYRVKKSTPSDGTNVILTLERGLITAMASGEDGFLNQNMYSKLSCQLPNAGKPDASSVGVNLVRAVASRWIWIQTWGPLYISGGDERLGADNDRREAYFHQDGTLMCPAAFGQTQRAGYAINECDGTSTWYVYLQLARE